MAASPQSPSLIDLFVETYQDAYETPGDYLWWAGVALTSALMGRQVWTNIRAESAEDRLFGNLFILLIGNPGTGKGAPTGRSRQYALGHGVRVGPDDITGERLIHYCKTFKWDSDRGRDELLEKKKRGRTREDTSEGPKGTISIFLNEFEHLFHRGNSDALKRVLTDFYDCREEPYTRETFQHGEQVIEKMCMTLLAGATPSHMGKLFLRDEWQEGLPSRFVYVWGDQPEIKDSFVIAPGAEKKLKEAITTTRAHIVDSMKIGWTAEARSLRIKWRRNNIGKGPPHTLLMGYNTRRHVALSKIAFVAAVARCSPKIEACDWRLAVEKLATAEKTIHMALSQAGGNEHRGTMEWAAAWVATRPKGVHESELRFKLGQTISPVYITTIIDEMVNSRMVRALGERTTFSRTFLAYKETRR